MSARELTVCCGKKVTLLIGSHFAVFERYVLKLLSVLPLDVRSMISKGFV